MLVLPIDIKNQLFLPLGELYLGRCIPKTCSSFDLKNHFLENIEQTSSKVLNWKNSLNLYEKGFVKFIEQTIIDTTFVICDDEIVDYIDSHHNFGFYLFMFIFITLLICLVFGTFYEIMYMNVIKVIEPENYNNNENYYNNIEQNITGYTRKPESTLESIILSFSLINNIKRLTANVEGDFRIFNSFRVLAMFGVIWGHTVLYSSGNGFGRLSSIDINLSAFDKQLQHWTMQIFKGFEFNVDTFFLMSGFLASWGILKDISKNRGKLTFKRYITLIFGRYLRLTPTYAFVILFFSSIASHLGGNGLNWGW